MEEDLSYIVGEMENYNRDNAYLLDIEELFEAIEHLIKSYKELEEENRIMALEGSRVRLKMYINENYIPKSLVKEIRDKAECMDYYTLSDVIEDLNNLLGDDK